ncbi:MAG TPA: LysR family transcriptional regulator [Magnetospirillaceae bacterium]|jgi:DNA-binding transcriptional LysR family regulator
MDRLASLTAFVRVVESHGFSAASRRMNMSVTNVSNHIKALEDHLGARLLNRTTRRVSLTDTGKAYYDKAVLILAELEEADQIALAQQRAPRGTLRIYTSVHIVRFISPALADLLRLHPEVSVELMIGERAVDLVEEGYDIAIRTIHSGESSLIVRRLSPWRHFLGCSPAYLETHPAPQHPRDLAQHNCMRYPYYPFGDDWRFEGPDGAIVSQHVSGNLLTSSAETMRYMALQSQGIIFAPSFFAVDDFQSGRLVRLLPDYRGVEFAISAVYPHRHHVSAKVRVFIDMMADYFTSHRQWLDPDAAALGAYA